MKCEEASWDEHSRIVHYWVKAIAVHKISDTIRIITVEVSVSIQSTRKFFVFGAYNVRCL